MPGSRRRWYPDACVFLAYFNDEDDRADLIADQLRRLRRERIGIWTSVLTLSEVAYSAREGKHLDPDATDFLDEFFLQGGYIHFAQVNREIALAARDLVRRTRAHGPKQLGTADAIHIASAIDAGAEVFLTYGSDLLRLDMGLPFSIEQPASAEYQRSLFPAS